MIVIENGYILAVRKSYFYDSVSEMVTYYYNPIEGVLIFIPVENLMVGVKMLQTDDPMPGVEIWVNKDELVEKYGHGLGVILRVDIYEKDAKGEKYERS